jgi:hypothetical protein
MGKLLCVLGSISLTGTSRENLPIDAEAFDDARQRSHVHA